jgi:septal ring-binding cell division protein DamX
VSTLKDWAVIVFGILILLLVFIGIPAAYIAAPCDKLDWMPTHQAPSRCLPGGRG